MIQPDDHWIGILEGNTHHRWGYFQSKSLMRVERYPAAQSPELPNDQDIWIASVTRQLPQTHSDRIHWITLDQIPLGNTYPTLGIDRALGLVAAGYLYGWPVLVIDAGTAITISGADPSGNFVGGAILPGLGSQAKALHHYTKGLPLVDFKSITQFPQRWALDTESAIYSGILLIVTSGLQAYCQDWLRQFPECRIVVTGGDGSVFDSLFTQNCFRHTIDPYLSIRGISIVNDS